MLVKSVEFVEAAPGTHAAQSHKEASHRTQIKLRVAVEYEDKSAQLGAQRLDCLGLARACGSKWSAATSRRKCMCECGVARCCQGCLYKPLL